MGADTVSQSSVPHTYTLRHPYIESTSLLLSPINPSSSSSPADTTTTSGEVRRAYQLFMPLPLFFLLAARRTTRRRMKHVGHRPPPFLRTKEANRATDQPPLRFPQEEGRALSQEKEEGGGSLFSNKGVSPYPTHVFLLPFLLSPWQ